jgi:hypothetical protein
MRDAIAGDRIVKEKNTLYLPKRSGFNQMSDAGREEYAHYLLRAQFPRVVAPTIRGMLGVIHRRAADVKVPKVLEPIFEKATPDGAPLETLHKRITYELLSTGRYTLFVDAPSEGDDDFPYIAGYDAEHLINWSRFNDFFVFDESSIARDGFVWTPYNKYRVLKYEADPADVLANVDNPDYVPQKRYTVTVFDRTTDEAQAVQVEPTIRGGKAWDEIPCVVIGSTDVRVDIDEIPLLGVAQAAYAGYRLDADYRYQLFMSGQETLVMTNAEGKDIPKAVGAGVILTLPEQSDCKYVGPSGKGIEMHRTAIQDEKDNAASAGVKLFDAKEKAAESGDALRIRFAGQTASLTSIAISSAQGLEKALKFAAKMVGADPDQVQVRPNLSFVESVMTGQDALNMMQLWQGHAISKETLYEALQKGEIASTERTFEDEQALIEDEMPPPGQMPVNVPPPTDQQLNAFKQGQPFQSNGRVPPQAPRPGTKKFNPKKPRNQDQAQ